MTGQALSESAPAAFIKLYDSLITPGIKGVIARASKAQKPGDAGGKADLFKTGRITSSLLDAYATKRVGDLTGGRQHPLMYRPRDSADFDIAVVR